MALIQCPECGREISSQAAACPHCGMPINATPAIPEVPKVRVAFRREKRFIGSAVSGQVVIDGTVAGAAGSGGGFEVMLAPGDHTVIFNASANWDFRIVGRSDSQTLHVPDDAGSMTVTYGTRTDASNFFGINPPKFCITDIEIRRRSLSDTRTVSLPRPTRTPAALPGKEAPQQPRTSWHCPVCGRINPPTEPVCRCGTFRSAGAGNGPWRCAYCGQRNDPDADRCARCGGKRK